MSEFLTKIENILTYRLVAQAGLKEEKTGGRKSRWTVPFMQGRHLSLMYG